MKVVIILLGFCLSLSFFSQKQITWEDLDCDFDEIWSEEYQAVYVKPKFDDTQKALDGEIVSINGYIYLMDMMDSIHPYYILSNKEFTSGNCNFGMTEEHILMEFNSEVLKNELLGKFVLVKGKLRLNGDDILYLTYILDNAKIIE